MLVVGAGAGFHGALVRVVKELDAVRSLCRQDCGFKLLKASVLPVVGAGGGFCGGLGAGELGLWCEGAGEGEEFVQGGLC